MANNIKGITIEIGGNTTALSSALKEVNSAAKDIQSELKEVDKLLKLDPTNTVLLTQKEDLLADSIAKTKDKLDALKTAQSQLKPGDIGEDKYRALDREIAATESDLKKYKTQLSNVKPEQAELATGTHRLETYFKATGTEAKDFTSTLGSRLVNAIKDGTATSDQLKLALDKIGKSADLDEDELKQMKAALDAFDGSESSLNGVKTKLDEIGTSADSSGTDLDSIGKKIDTNTLQNVADTAGQVGQKMVDFGQKAYDAYATYDAGIDTIIKKTGATGDAVDEFSGIYRYLVDNVAVTDPYSKAGEAVGELNTQFGLTGQSLQDSSEMIMKFAELNDTDVTTSVQQAEQAMSSYGLSADKLPDVLDSVTYASQKTGASADDIFSSCVDGSDVLQQMGLDFSESALLMGGFSQAGVDSSTAITQLNKANVKFAQEGKTMKDGLSELQAVVSSNATEQEKLTAVSEVFGTKGSAAFLKLAESGKLNFADLAGAADDASGSVDSTFESVTGADEKMELAMTKLNTAMADIGGVIAETLAPVLDALAPVLESISGFIGGMPEPLKILVGVIALLVAGLLLIAPSLTSILIAANLLGPSLVTSGASAVTASGGFFALDASLLPIILTVAAVVAGIVALILIIQNWDAICTWFQDQWDAFTSFLQDQWDNFYNWFTSTDFGAAVTGALDTAKTMGEETWGFFCATLTGDTDGAAEHLQNIFNALPQPVQDALTQVANVGVPAYQALTDFLRGDTDSAEGHMMEVFNALPQPIKDALTQIATIAQPAYEAFTSFLSGNTDDAATHMQEVFDALPWPIQEAIQNVYDKVMGVVNKIKDDVSAAMDKIKGFFEGDWPTPHINLPHFSIAGSLSINPPSVPTLDVEWYAKGGILTQPTIFGATNSTLLGGGEAGAEAILPIENLQAYMTNAIAASTFKVETLTNAVKDGVNASGLALLLSTIIDVTQAIQKQQGTATNTEAMSDRSIIDLIKSSISLQQNAALRSKGY